MTFRQTISKAIEGDLDAKKQIIKSYAHVIDMECRKFGLHKYPDLTPSDLGQEVKVRVWTKLHCFNVAEANQPEKAFVSWLRTTSRRVVQNLLRHRGNTFKSPGSPIKPITDNEQNLLGENMSTASSILSQREDIAYINETIEKQLDPESQDILRLRVVDGLTFTEISERTGLSIDQVRYRFEKSLQMLTPFLGN